MRKLSICTGNSRMAANWPKSETTFSELYEKLKNPLRTGETVEQYKKMKKGQRDEAKDKGGFMAGTLKGVKRRKHEVVSRSMITLDGDKLEEGFIEDYEFTNPYEAILYTTHSHTTESPRARILLPLTRDVTPEEYIAIARYLCADMGIDMFDPCSFEINQLMYWPTCPSDGEYVCEYYEGEWLDPDKYLAGHPDWKDPVKLPRAACETKSFDTQKKKQEDPISKTGAVGAYCRAHSISDVMARELSDIYEATDDDTRYHYIPSDSIAGVMVYDDKFVYSHHASDPAYGQLLNAFDLVRIHKFGDDGSFNAMMEYATKDEETKMLLLKERQERAQTEFAETDDDDDSWKKAPGA